MATLPATLPFPLGESTVIEPVPVPQPIHYPAGPVTPHGEYHIMKGDIPDVDLEAYDGSIIFHLMGGRSIPDRYLAPERVEIPRDGLKGLVAPWQMIDQKGATEDGVTFIDALYDPMIVDLTAIAKGKTPERTRRVVRHLIASLDAKRESKLSWYTHELGYWWANLRWLETAANISLAGVHANRQEVPLRLRADNSFWRTFDDVGTFEFGNEDFTETFDVDYSGDQDLGPNWPQYYSGSGAGYCSTTSGPVFFDLIEQEQARWYESGNQAREVVNGPYKDFHTDTNNQVINMVIGQLPNILYAPNSFNDLWGRMSRDGSGNWTGNGIRLRVGILNGFSWIKLSRFNNFVETMMREFPMLIPPSTGEKFTLICGHEGNERRFSVQRNGFPLLFMDVTEIGTGSLLGAAYRGVGFGMAAGPEIFSFFEQAPPAWVRKISAGDNSTITQSGFIQRINIGDQPRYDRFTCYGPGLFSIADGPDGDSIQFGPLTGNQVMQLRTDPRKRGVIDLTSIPPTPQELDFFQQALKDFISFATAGNVPPLLQELQSVFGILPPQGNPYSLLSGRFSKASAIPAKSPGRPAESYQIAVSIDDGNAMSRIIAAGTPLLRYPQ